MRTDDTAIGVLLLAAGASSRLGYPKQLLPLGPKGQSLLRHAAEVATASLCGSDVVVVLGANAERMKRELSGLPVTVVCNEAWEEGMASSLRSGLNVLTRAHSTISAVVVLLCDQPQLTVETVNALVAAFRTTEYRIVASQYEGGPGAPCLFDHSFFPELRALTGSEGAKRVIVRHGDQVALVLFAGGAQDMDTQSDVERALQSRSHSSCAGRESILV